MGGGFGRSHKKGEVRGGLWSGRGVKMFGLSVLDFLSDVNVLDLLGNKARFFFSCRSLVARHAWAGDSGLVRSDPTRSFRRKSGLLRALVWLSKP